MRKATGGGKRQSGRSDRRSRSLDVELYIRRFIESNHLAAGARLPTETALSKELAVSRAVVREAIATLRAEGLVETKQGSGLFVANTDTDAKSKAGLANINVAEVASYVEVLEVRAAVESEAAALTAERCSPACLVRIRECCSAFAARAKADQLAADEDFGFHLAVAEGTNNQQFVRYFEYIVRQTILPMTIGDGHPVSSVERGFLREVIAEHERVLKAIMDRNPQAAREAMHDHILRGIRRAEHCISIAQS